jgi:hypothetical protein
MNESPRFQGQERSNNPDMFAELGKAIADQWKSISEDDHHRYKDLAAQDMERYSREMSEYRLKRAKSHLRGYDQGSATTLPSTFRVDQSLAQETAVVAALRSSGSTATSQGQDSGLASILSGPGFSQASQMGRAALLQSVYATQIRSSGLMEPRDSSSFFPYWSPRQEHDDIAAAQALRIRHLESVVARQQQQITFQQMLQQAFSLGWPASAAAIFGNPPTALTINRGSLGLPAASNSAVGVTAAPSSGWECSLYPSQPSLPFSLDLTAALSGQPSARLHQQLNEAETRTLYSRLLSEQQQQQQQQQQEDLPRPPQRENDQDGEP